MYLNQLGLIMALKSTNTA